MDSTKKRHRRTKDELLQDPAYCAKHGIKYVKGEIKKPILTAKKKSKVKKEVKKAEEPKKRHRKMEHGFRKRMADRNGRKVLARRRAKGRKQLSY